jgi:glycosyltransferase involved in cell wall biosynthesis
MIKIIITSYNNSEWTGLCLSSVLKQTYKNFEILFFDDCSTDNTYDIVTTLKTSDPRIRCFRMRENLTKSYIFANHIEEYMIDNNDIVLFLDGDDWLSDDDVFQNIIDFYEFNSPWVAYGGMLVWESGETVSEAHPQNTSFPPNVLIDKTFRKDAWRSSHLKTMRGFIWNNIDKSCFVSDIDKKYIKGGDDLAFMYPALEMCPMHKIFSFKFPTYVYNASNQGRIKSHMAERNVDYETEIRNRKPIDTLPFITCNLAGGLGNILFQIAATISTAKKHKYLPIFDPDTHYLPMQGQNIKTYRNNILKNIILDHPILIKESFSENGFQYTEINVPPFASLNGYFQSEKYFDKELIKQTFSCPPETSEIINKKYGHLYSNNVSSLHVRRGDYLNLTQYHPLCQLSYYEWAMKTVNADKYLVFSDDIEWCKQTFKGNQFEFIKDEDYIELYMMSKCNHNIIANSTFSWWGAWLNESTSKIVAAPTEWFGPAYSHYDMSDLIPKEWIKYVA